LQDEESGIRAIGEGHCNSDRAFLCIDDIHTNTRTLTHTHEDTF
jgi:hypothetical protein